MSVRTSTKNRKTKPVQPSPFGTAIRSLRLKANLSAREVANKMGITHVFLCEVERGIRPPFYKERLLMWAEAVNVKERVLQLMFLGNLCPTCGGRRTDRRKKNT